MYFKSRLIAFLLSLSMLPVALSAETITLKNGTTLVGKITSESEGKVLFKDSILGNIEFASSVIISRSSSISTSTESLDKPSSDSKEAAVAVTTQNKDSRTNTDENTPKWSRSAGISYSYASGPAPSAGIGDNINYSLNVDIKRQSKTNSISFDASLAYSATKPYPAFSDSKSALLTYEHFISKDFRISSMTSYGQNKPQGYDRSLLQMVGLPYQAVNNDEWNIFYGPILAGFQYKEIAPAKATNHLGYGFYQSITYKLTPALSIEEKLQALEAFDNTAFYSYNGSLSLIGQLSKSLSLKNTLQLQRNPVAPRGFKTNSTQVMSGIQVAF